MSTPIPPPLRAAAGLAAVVIDSARKLPEQLVGLPVLAVSTALQASLKAQQRYAELIARGDEVLAQLRGVEEAPAWARFDEDPTGAPPRSAFDAAPPPASGPPGEDLLDELAADQLGGGEPEADLLADAEAGLDADGPVLEPDGVAATEAQAGGLDVGEVPLYDTAPRVDPSAGRSTPGSGGDLPAGPGEDATEAGRAPGSVSEPGVDLPAGPAEDAEDAEEVDAAVPASAVPASAVPASAVPASAVPAAAEPAAGLDGYLAVEPPIARYDELSVPQLRGRLRSLSEARIEELIAYERANAARPAYLTMLENRLVTLRSR